MEDSSLLAYWEVNNTATYIIPRIWNKIYSPNYRVKYFTLNPSPIIFSDIYNSKINSITYTAKLVLHFAIRNIVDN